jgi:hypothetical protein
MLLAATAGVLAAAGRHVSSDPCSQSFYEIIFLVSARCIDTGPDTRTCDIASGYTCDIEFDNDTLDLDCDSITERCTLTVDTRYQQTGVGYCRGTCATTGSTSLMYTFVMLMIVILTVLLIAVVFYLCKKRRDTAITDPHLTSDPEYFPYPLRDPSGSYPYVPSPYGPEVAYQNDSPAGCPQEPPDYAYGKPLYPHGEARPEVERELP